MASSAFAAPSVNGVWDYSQILVHIAPISAKIATKEYPVRPGDLEVGVSSKSPHLVQIRALNGGRLAVSRLQFKNLVFDISHERLTIDGKPYKWMTKGNIQSSQGFEMCFSMRKVCYRLPGALVWTEVVDRGHRIMEYINALWLEDYVRSVTFAEMGGLGNLEADKAQAISVRSYTLYNTQLRREKTKYFATRGYDVEPTSVGDQMYLGLNGSNPQVDQAVRDTAGQVLTYQGAIADTLYHSNSGGLTCAFVDCFGKGARTKVRGNPFPYLRSVRDPPEVRSPRAFNGQSKIRITAARIKAWLRTRYKARDLQTHLGKVQAIDISDNASRRINEIVIVGKLGEIKLTGREAIQFMLGGVAYFPSRLCTRFSADSSGDFWTTCYGAGHGVGMSQVGAIVLAADHHESYLQILRHYFPETRIEHRYF